MPANDPIIPLTLQLPSEHFTEAQLRAALEAAITDQFVKNLHHAHQHSGTVNVTTHKELM